MPAHLQLKINENRKPGSASAPGPFRTSTAGFIGSLLSITRIRFSPNPRPRPLILQTTPGSGSASVCKTNRAGYLIPRKQLSAKPANCWNQPARTIAYKIDFQRKYCSLVPHITQFQNFYNQTPHIRAGSGFRKRCGEFNTFSRLRRPRCIWKNIRSATIQLLAKEVREL